MMMEYIMFPSVKDILRGNDFLIYLAALLAYGSSQVRNQIQAIAVTYTTAAARRDP